MRNYLNQQLENKDKQLKDWQKRAQVAEEIAKGVQDELRNRINECDELANKNGLIEKELAKVKRSTKGKMNADKEMTDSLKKERNGVTKKLEDQKEKNRLFEIAIEKKRRIGAQYIVQLEEERSARKVI